MKINPYLYFNGNAAEAITFYERAFGGSAVVMKYTDVAAFDSTYKIAKGTENFVMHANMNLGDSMIMFCDVTPDIAGGFSSGMQMLVNLDSKDQVQKVFAALKEGGEIVMDLQNTFWSELFGSVKDRFGITWLLSYENEIQQKQSYGN